MLKLAVVRWFLWGLADHGVMRRRIEELFKRPMVVRAPDADRAGASLRPVEEPTTAEPRVVRNARSAAR
jgi:hypothetical protein